MSRTTRAESSDYNYTSSEHSCAHEYIIPKLEKIISALRPATIFDLGCGNGSITYRLSKSYIVRGVDISETGIIQAKSAHPELEVAVGSVYDDLVDKYGQFDCVVSLEVIEHLYSPRTYARNMFNLVKPGGVAVVSTPYHGYLKNLALAATGKLDQHFTALWDGGHIKFWSVRTLSDLLKETGFTELEFQFSGRIPALARSMIAIARRPV